MLSRVAENLYWMARYLERTEDTARLINVSVNLMLDLPRGIAPGWEPLIAITGSRERFLESYSTFTESNALLFLLGSGDQPSSILFALRGARENCRTIRDIVPREVWEQINELHLYAQGQLGAGLTKVGRHAYLKQIILGCQTIAGQMSGTMNHDQGYQFLRLGRFLERADMITRIIDVRSAGLVPGEAAEQRPFDTIQWVSVLKSLTGYQMYRRSMQVSVRRPDVLRFLLLDKEFPRSMMFSLNRLENSLSRLKHSDPPRQLAYQLSSILQAADVTAMDQMTLHRFLDDLQLGLIELHNEVSRVYFLPVPEAAGGA